MLNAKLKFPARRHKASAFSLQPSAFTCAAFTLIEVMVVVVLMSFIVLMLMAVFNSTQAAFRASLTQSDVLEGGRSVTGLIKSDFESMTPSFGQSNQRPDPNGYTTNAVNFCVITNFGYQPLVQSLVGASNPNDQRTNVLENFFILTRQNTTWTGIGYVVDNTSTNDLNPLYRFSMSTNVMGGDPAVLYYNFLTNLPDSTGHPILPNTPNLSHLVDGVVHLTVRPYDINGRWMTNFYTFYTLDGTNYTTTNRNVWFLPPDLGEVGFYMFSNTLPASVEIELGVLEDRTIQRAQTWPNNSAGQSNYLSLQAAKVHLFRQRIPIRNVDPSAYQ